LRNLLRPPPVPIGGALHDLEQDRRQGTVPERREVWKLERVEIAGGHAGRSQASSSHTP
jgi:hypothetical protein